MNHETYVPVVTIYENGTVDIDFSSSFQGAYDADGEEVEGKTVDARITSSAVRLIEGFTTNMRV